MAEPPLRRDETIATTYTTPTTPTTPVVGTGPTTVSPIAPPPGAPVTTTGYGVGGKRPTGVTVLAVLAGIAAVFALLGAMGAFAGGALLAANDAAGFGAVAAALGVFLLVYAVLAAAVCYGLLKRARWAWYATVILAGLGVVSALFSLLAGDFVSALLGLALNGFILWYILKPEVQAWFGVRYNTPWKYGGRPA